jgi:hypothetical protein
MEPDLTYKAYVTEIKLVGQDGAAFTAVTFDQANNTVMQIAGAFPRSKVNDISIQDVIEVTVTFKPAVAPEVPADPPKTEALLV